MVDELDRIFGADDGTGRARRRAPPSSRHAPRAQGAGDLARDRDHPDLPRGLRRRRLSERNRLGELKADTDVFTTFEGDNTILLQLVAKSLLTGYRDDFADLDPIGDRRLRRRPGLGDGGRAHRRPASSSSG